MSRIIHDGTYDQTYSLEQVSLVLGVSVESARRLEEVALLKVRIGLALIELLGTTHAEVVLAELRSQPLPHWQRTYSALRAEHRRLS